MTWYCNENCECFDVTKFKFSEHHVEIMYPASKKYGKNLFYPQNYQMTLSTNGDGVTRTWSIPYMGK